MGIGMPAYPTLMELRSAGWTLEQIASTYGVNVPEIQSALKMHFSHCAPRFEPSRKNTGLATGHVSSGNTVSASLDAQTSE